MKLSCILIDDEQDAIRLLERILVDFCQDKIEIYATTTNSVEGIKLIHKLHPDIVFLDIEMPGVSGFDLLEINPGINSKIVFVTAYDKHAIRAIKYKPDGYLLKPIDVNELITTIGNLYLEKANHKAALLTQSKYSISAKDETILVDLSEILFIKAMGRYSDVWLSHNRILKGICKNIGHFEKELEKRGFVRCHKSYLVNTKHIIKLNKTDGGFIEISNGTSIEISRRKRNTLFTNA